MSVFFELNPFSAPHLQIRWNGKDLEITLVFFQKDQPQLQTLFQDARCIADTLGVDKLEIDSAMEEIFDISPEVPIPVHPTPVHPTLDAECSGIPSPLEAHVTKILETCRLRPHHHPDFSKASEKVRNYIQSTIGWQISLSTSEAEEIRVRVARRLPK